MSTDVTSEIMEQLAKLQAKCQRQQILLQRWIQDPTAAGLAADTQKELAEGGGV